MNTTVRLQRPWDIDLITLSKHPDFNFSLWTKKALTAWGKDDNTFFIPCPDNYPTDDTRPVVIHINLNPEKDRAVINKLLKIKEGYRNSFIKNLIRHYMDKPYVYTYGPEDLFENISHSSNTNSSENSIIPSDKKEDNRENAAGIKDVVKDDKSKPSVVENTDKQEIAEISVEKEIEQVSSTEVKEAVPEPIKDMEDTGFDLFGAIDKMT